MARALEANGYLVTTIRVGLVLILWTPLVVAPL